MEDTDLFSPKALVLRRDFQDMVGTAEELFPELVTEIQHAYYECITDVDMVSATEAAFKVVGTRGAFKLSVGESTLTKPEAMERTYEILKGSTVNPGMRHQMMKFMQERAVEITLTDGWAACFKVMAFDSGSQEKSLRMLVTSLFQLIQRCLPSLTRAVILLIGETEVGYEESTFLVEAIRDEAMRGHAESDEMNTWLQRKMGSGHGCHARGYSTAQSYSALVTLDGDTLRKEDVFRALRHVCSAGFREVYLLYGGMASRDGAWRVSSAESISVEDFQERCRAYRIPKCGRLFVFANSTYSHHWNFQREMVTCVGATAAQTPLSPILGVRLTEVPRPTDPTRALDFYLFFKVLANTFEINLNCVQREVVHRFDSRIDLLCRRDPKWIPAEELERVRKYRNPQLFALPAGPGSCTLIRVSEEEGILFDTGSQKSFMFFVFPLIVKVLRLSRLHIVVSRPDEEHIGGAVWLLNALQHATDKSFLRQVTIRFSGELQPTDLLNDAAVERAASPRSGKMSPIGSGQVSPVSVAAAAAAAEFAGTGAMAAVLSGKLSPVRATSPTNNSKANSAVDARAGAVSPTKSRAGAVSPTNTISKSGKFSPEQMSPTTVQLSGLQDKFNSPCYIPQGELNSSAVIKPAEQSNPHSSRFPQVFKLPKSRTAQSFDAARPEVTRLVESVQLDPVRLGESLRLEASKRGGDRLEASSRMDQVRLDSRVDRQDASSRVDRQDASSRFDPTRSPPVEDSPLASPLQSSPRASIVKLPWYSTMTFSCEEDQSYRLPPAVTSPKMRRFKSTLRIKQPAAAPLRRNLKVTCLWPPRDKVSTTHWSDLNELSTCSLLVRASFQAEIVPQSVNLFGRPSILHASTDIFASPKAAKASPKVPAAAAPDMFAPPKAPVAAAKTATAAAKSAATVPLNPGLQPAEPAKKQRGASPNPFRTKSPVPMTRPRRRSANSPRELSLLPLAGLSDSSPTSTIETQSSNSRSPDLFNLARYGSMVVSPFASDSPPPTPAAAHCSPTPAAAFCSPSIPLVDDGAATPVSSTEEFHAPALPTLATSPQRTGMLFTGNAHARHILTAIQSEIPLWLLEVPSHGSKEPYRNAQEGKLFYSMLNPRYLLVSASEDKRMSTDLEVMEYIVLANADVQQEIIFPYYDPQLVMYSTLVSYVNPQIKFRFGRECEDSLVCQMRTDMERQHALLYLWSTMWKKLHDLQQAPNFYTDMEWSNRVYALERIKDEILCGSFALPQDSSSSLIYLDI